MSSSPRRPSDKVTFRESDHTYWLGEPGEGVRLFGATELLTAVGLIDTRYFTPASAERGTFSHQATAIFDRHRMGMNVGEKLDEEKLDPALRPFLTAYKKFTEACQPAWTDIEAPLYDKALRLAGTVDRVGMMRPGGTGKKRKVVLDIKTGSHANWHPLQLAVYQHLVTKRLVEAGAAPQTDTNKPMFERYGLYLTKRGTYALKHFTTATDIAVVMGARAVALWKESHGA